MKKMLPNRSIQKKKFNAELLKKFLKSKKMTLKSLSEKGSDFDGREKLVQDFGVFVHKNI